MHTLPRPTTTQAYHKRKSHQRSEAVQLVHTRVEHLLGDLCRRPPPPPPPDPQHSAHCAESNGTSTADPQSSTGPQRSAAPQQSQIAGMSDEQLFAGELDPAAGKLGATIRTNEQSTDVQRLDGLAARRRPHAPQAAAAPKRRVARASPPRARLARRRVWRRLRPPLAPPRVTAARLPLHARRGEAVHEQHRGGTGRLLRPCECGRLYRQHRRERLFGLVSESATEE